MFAYGASTTFSQDTRQSHVDSELVKKLIDEYNRLDPHSPRRGEIIGELKRLRDKINNRLNPTA